MSDDQGEPYCSNCGRAGRHCAACDDQDTTAPGRVNITIKRATIAQSLAGQYPAMMAESFRAALVARSFQLQDPASIALRAKQARRARWKLRLRSLALATGVAVATLLVLAGVFWLLGVPRP